MICEIMSSLSVRSLLLLILKLAPFRGLRSGYLWVVGALVLLLASGGFAVITLSAVPKSRNVSVGTLVEFTCATEESGVILAITATPTVVGSVPNQTDLPNGGNQFMLSFTAPSEHSSITVTCVAIRGSDILQSIAFLMIQGPLSGVGDLTSSEVDNCTLHFTWSAPYTLPGVPINYYTINITRHSDGAVLRSDTTNTTEYLYTVSSLGETLEVVVAAVNGAGTGDQFNISVVTPLSSISGINITTNRSDDVRNKNNWSYVFNMTEISMCGNVVINRNAISNVTIEACNDSLCISARGVISMSANGVRRVMATFTNLEENSKYSASVHVQYNGGVVQQSQPVEISTSDLMNFTFDSVATRKCLNVTAIYVKGHVVDSSVALFKHTTNERLSVNTTVQKWECLDSLTTNESYNVLGIDSDSPVADINTSPAVNLTGVYVPMFLHVAVAETPTTTSSESPVPTTIEPLIPQWIWILIVVVVIVLIAIATCIISIWITIYLTKFKKKRRVAGKCPPEPEPEKKNKTYYEAEVSPLPEKNGLEDQTCNQEQEMQYASVQHKEQVFNTLEADTNVEYGTIATTLPEKECIDHLHNMPTLELNQSTVYGLLMPLSDQWHDLGEELGVSPYLSEIRSMFYENEERLFEVLRIWEHLSIRSYTWNTLVTALESKKISRLMLASEIRKALHGTNLYPLL